ncbi:MAG: hypothetical protein AAGF67_05130 [Verrucomicrobiota bacterium]
MFEPDTLPYYFAMFGAPFIVPAIIVGFLIYGKGKPGHLFRSRWAFGITLGAGAVLSLLVNPVTYVFTTPMSDARVAAMHDQIQTDHWIGVTQEEFTRHFGAPDKTISLAEPQNELLVYTCVPKFAYGWDTLHVFIDEGRISGARIDD